MRKTTQQDKSIVLDILCSSFDDNPSVKAVVKPDNRRSLRVRWLMDYAYKMCSAFGEVWLSQDRNACALILFPDKKRMTINTLSWDLQLASNVIGFSRVLRILQRESAIKATHPSKSFAYLWFVGVAPGSQGKGIGSSLMREITDEYQRQKRDICLETSVIRNVDFYKKTGFQLFKTLDVGYPLFAMRRTF